MKKKKLLLSLQSLPVRFPISIYTWLCTYCPTLTYSSPKRVPFRRDPSARNSSLPWAGSFRCLGLACKRKGVRPWRPLVCKDCDPPYLPAPGWNRPHPGASHPDLDASQRSQADDLKEWWRLRVGRIPSVLGIARFRASLEPLCRGGFRGSFFVPSVPGPHLSVFYGGGSDAPACLHGRLIELCYEQCPKSTTRVWRRFRTRPFQVTPRMPASTGTRPRR